MVSSLSVAMRHVRAGHKYKVYIIYSNSIYKTRKTKSESLPRYAVMVNAVSDLFIPSLRQCSAASPLTLPFLGDVSVSSPRLLAGEGLTVGQRC